MPNLSALEFQRYFGQFHRETQRKSVETTRHARREFVLMSSE
ncbi:MAG: hypothetical protein OXI81_01755 [Paracoccaceae bacterium]|nr:hypothetical protein [Paracoccaceae bacterium]